MEIIKDTVFEGTATGSQNAIFKKDIAELLVDNCKISNFVRSGVKCEAIQKVTIKNTSITAGPLSRAEKYSYGIFLGLASTPSRGNKEVFIENTLISGFGPESSDYNLYNRDCLSAEPGNGAVYLKLCDFQGATDAVMDLKSPAYAMNCDFRDSYRVLRVWNSPLVLSNCRISGPRKLFWLGSPTARVLIHRGTCTFNGSDTLDPALVSYENGAMASQVEFVTENPLPKIPFFEQAEKPATMADLATLAGEVDKELSFLKERLAKLESWGLNLFFKG